MYGYIYKITNLNNGKLYVGKTVRPVQRRFKIHISTALRNKPKHNHIKLYSAIRKYGPESFIVEQIDTAETEEELNKKEQYWIAELHTFIDDPACNGYNMTAGGEGGSWSDEMKSKYVATKRANDLFKLSEKTKRKLSIANKNKPKSEIHKQHLRDNHHLKTTHILYYQDGHTELSTDSIQKLGERLNVSATKLRRASEVGEFRCGAFFLLDLIDYRVAFRHKYRYSREKIVIDPVSNDILSLHGMRSKYQNHPELYGYQYPEYQLAPKYQDEFDTFKNNLENIRQNALKGAEKIYNKGEIA